MRRGNSGAAGRRCCWRQPGCLAGTAGTASAARQRACTRPVYLSFDTGHMGVAPLVAEVLKRHEVKVTFFLANEKTLTGGSSLDDSWAPWWRRARPRAMPSARTPGTTTAGWPMCPPACA